LLHLTREGKLKTMEYLYEHSGGVVLTYGLGGIFSQRGVKTISEAFSGMVTIRLYNNF
jgi:hypothetical protein